MFIGFNFKTKSHQKVKKRPKKGPKSKIFIAAFFWDTLYLHYDSARITDTASPGEQLYQHCNYHHQHELVMKNSSAITNYQRQGSTDNLLQIEFKLRLLA